LWNALLACVFRTDLSSAEAFSIDKASALQKRVLAGSRVRGTGVQRTGEAVITCLRCTRLADVLLTLIIRRAGIAVITGGVVGDSDASEPGVAEIVRAQIAIVAADGEVDAARGGETDIHRADLAIHTGDGFFIALSVIAPVVGTHAPIFTFHMIFAACCGRC